MTKKNETALDHINRINRVLNHIQQNLDSSITLETLAGIACFSPFHFHRIFRAHLGESLNSYIRRLRLERSSLLLCYSDETITDIAFRAGYETPSAFSKAFRQHFGETPTSFRENKTIALVQDERAVIKTKKGENSMQHEIRERDDTLVIYSRKIGDYNTTAAEAWKSVCAYAYPQNIVAEDAEFIGISHDNPEFTEEEKRRYDACISVDQKVATQGEIGVQTIPGGKYAVFLHKGPYENLVTTYGFIFGEWIQKVPDQLSERPCFEKYLNDPEQTPAEELLTEIFVPVED